MYFSHQQILEPQILRNQKICFEPHMHNDVEIIILYHGTVELLADGEKYVLYAGDALIIFPNIVHSYTSGEDVDVGKFIFNTENIRDLDTVFQTMRPQTPVLRRETVIRANLIAFSQEILCQYPSSSQAVKRAYLLLLTGKLLELCRLEEKKTAGSKGILISIFEYCKQNFHRDITLREVAEALYISPSYLSHIFCEKLKINFRQYVNILRISESTVLLRQTDLKISEIAEQSGFGTLRNFDRSFEKHIGITPKKYRRLKMTNG